MLSGLHAAGMGDLSHVLSMHTKISSPVHMGLTKLYLYIVAICQCLSPKDARQQRLCLYCCQAILQSVSAGLMFIIAVCESLELRQINSKERSCPACTAFINLRVLPLRAGNWSEQLLRSMYFLTWQHAGAFPSETERLWTTVAANKRNIIPILDFLIARGLQEAAEPHLQACNFSFFPALFCL